jgi:CRP/FNR family cyclic AMP-dependent transcriptional regulator
MDEKKAAGWQLANESVKVIFTIVIEGNDWEKSEIVTVLNRAGDVFGEMRFIDNAPRSATVIAEKDVVCIALDSDYIDKLSGKDKVTFGYIFYRVISEIIVNRLRTATTDLMGLKGKEDNWFSQ